MFKIKINSSTKKQRKTLSHKIPRHLPLNVIFNIIPSYFLNGYKNSSFLQYNQNIAIYKKLKLGRLQNLK